MLSNPELGNRIRDARLAKELSQAEFARQLDVTSQTVWNWEANGAQPRPATLSAIAALLDVEESYLRGDEAQADTPLRSVPQIIRAAREEIAAILGFEIERVMLDLRIEN